MDSIYISPYMLPLIPSPRQISQKTGFLILNGFYLIQKTKDISGEIVADAAHALRQICTDFHINLLQESQTGVDRGQIIEIQYEKLAETESTYGPESYSLAIGIDFIKVKAIAPNGFYYGIQTLRQLYSEDIDGHNSPGFPLCDILDYPKYPMRGLMHDVGRNFLPLKKLKSHMRVLAAYKMNVFHWHLTDNPGWRIECKAYPRLNDPKNYRQTRDPGCFYTYDEIREFIGFCQELQITVIPEIDVPGHSKYFKRTFKTPMFTLRGMYILQSLLEEFFREIPIELAPYIHIGGDEVYIPNRKQFIRKITNIVRKANRTIIMWDPGLTPPQDVIGHDWSSKPKKGNQRSIDSTKYYVNNLDPLSAIPLIYFSKPGENKTNPQNRLGAILCSWPDVKVEDKNQIEAHSPLFPAILALAESTWHGRESSLQKYAGLLPTSENEEASVEFIQFESRLIHHRNLYFRDLAFPYIQQSSIKWNIIGPFPLKSEVDLLFMPNKEFNASYFFEGQEYFWQQVTGGTINLQPRNDGASLYTDIKAGVAFATTNIVTKKDLTIDAWIGFEVPTRSNRQYGGLPYKGEWDAHGGDLWLNGERLIPPNFDHAGDFRLTKRASWNRSEQEIPYCSEEFFWIRKPYQIHLKRGENRILMKIPKTYPLQDWKFTFVPVQATGGSKNPEEVSGLEFSIPDYIS